MSLKARRESTKLRKKLKRWPESRKGRGLGIDSLRHYSLTEIVAGQV